MTDRSEHDPKPETVAAAHGVASDPSYGAISPPLYLSSTYEFTGYNNARVHINNYVVLSASTGSADAIFGNLAAADLGIGANLNGAVPFPADNAWNTDISSAAIDPNSDTLIASIGLTPGLHPDFGAGLYDGAPIGIPYVVVGNGQPKVAISFTDYGDESDPGPYPVPANAPIEGALANGGAFDSGFKVFCEFTFSN